MAAILDRAAVMDNFMDDQELLFESIDLFLERIAPRLETLTEAVQRKDPEKIMIEAHTIKGMLGIFSTGAAFEASKAVELMGRRNDIAGVDEAFALMRTETQALVDELTAWRRE